jgi:hypothetical protein
MQELVAQAEAELESGSPSQKFVRIAESVMNALTDTITAYSDRPARAMQLALQSMVTAASFSPLQTIAGGAGVSNQYYANFGGVVINDQMGIAEFQALIRSTVAESLGGL